MPLLSTQAELEQAMDEWQRLAKAEAQAIRDRDWTGLAACQKAIRELQPEITRALQQSRGAHPGPDTAPAPAQQHFRSRAAQLITLEQENLALLHETREAARAKLNQSQQARRTLRRLHTSYASKPPSAWTSFS